MTLLEILLVCLVAGTLPRGVAQLLYRAARNAGQILSAALNSSS